MTKTSEQIIIELTKAVESYTDNENLLGGSELELPGFQFVTTQFVDQSRWGFIEMDVWKYDDGRLFGITYFRENENGEDSLGMVTQVEAFTTVEYKTISKA